MQGAVEGLGRGFKQEEGRWGRGAEVDAAESKRENEGNEKIWHRSTG